MAHPTDSLCDAVVTYLNTAGHPWSGDFTALYLPVESVRTDPNAAEKMLGYRVTVFPVLLDGTLADRSGGYEDEHTIGIAIRRKLTKGNTYDSTAGATEIKGFRSYAYTILQNLRENAVELTGVGARFDSGEWKESTGVSGESLREHNVYLCILQGTFQQLT